MHDVSVMSPIPGDPLQLFPETDTGHVYGLPNKVRSTERKSSSFNVDVRLAIAPRFCLEPKHVPHTRECTNCGGEETSTRIRDVCGRNNFYLVEAKKWTRLSICMRGENNDKRELLGMRVSNSSYGFHF